VEPRLKSRMWIQALIRRCDLAAIAATVIARGDDDAGAILLKFSGRDGGCSVLTQVRRQDGELVWMRATGSDPVSEAEADSYIERQRRRDPDIWVIEVESGSAAAVLDGHII
jgi:hypothetical protein